MKDTFHGGHLRLVLRKFMFHVFRQLRRHRHRLPTDNSSV